MTDVPTPTAPTFSDAEEAAQKRFNIMAAGGLLVVLTLAFFALTGGSDDAPVTAAPAPAAETPVETPVAEPVAEAPPPPPGVSSGGGGGSGRGGFAGSSGRPTSGASPSPSRLAAARNAVTAFTRERGAALGFSPRASAALADSAAGRRRAAPSSAVPSSAPTSGPATVGRATTLMSGPGTGTAVLAVPSGTRLTLSGCAPAAGGMWCRASHAGVSGWVSQADIGR